jgi:hypothetical protein
MARVGVSGADPILIVRRHRPSATQLGTLFVPIERSLVIESEGAAPLCEPARVQRDLQPEEQMGQGHGRISRIRHGRVFGLLN